MDLRQRLPVVVADDKTGVQFIKYHGGGKRRAVNVHSIATFGRCRRLFNGGMDALFRIKDGYLGIWMSFLYLLCGLFGRFICSKPGLQLPVHGHIILFDERHRSAYWR
jgi:hypothetical protein